mmetsp:Transcript_21141/g.48922  ORF Transcript_21141/g.48922 Transcript_21141/m.48922 type:complete len:205 (+) Transcript_21141:755-1369(+)
MSGLLSSGSHFFRKNLSPIFLRTARTASAAPPSIAMPRSTLSAETHAVRTHPAYPSVAPALDAPDATAVAIIPSTTLTLSSEVPRDTSCSTLSTLSWKLPSLTLAAMAESVLARSFSLLRMSAGNGVPVTSSAIHAIRSACACATFPPKHALCFCIFASTKETESSSSESPMVSLSSLLSIDPCAPARIRSKARTMGPMTTQGK